MKTFSKAFGSFWTGATGKRLTGYGPYPKLLAWYFLTSPAALAADNYGLFHVERATIERHLECDRAALFDAVAVLAEHQFAFWDSDSEWVWVREAAAWQYGTPLLPKDYVCTNARKWYRQLPRNPWLGYWFDRYLTDLNLQYDAERWVPRREWDGDKPMIANMVPLSSTRRAADLAVTPQEAPAFDRGRAVARLRSMKMNGAIGTAVAAAITKLEQGDVPLAIVNRQLLDVVIVELGAQIDEEANKEIAPWKKRLPADKVEDMRGRVRDRIARELLRLPDLEDRP